jgi:hypothetical protein
MTGGIKKTIGWPTDIVASLAVGRGGHKQLGGARWFYKNDSYSSSAIRTGIRESISRHRPRLLSLFATILGQRFSESFRNPLDFFGDTR